MWVGGWWVGGWVEATRPFGQRHRRWRSLLASMDVAASMDPISLTLLSRSVVALVRRAPADFGRPELVCGRRPPDSRVLPGEVGWCGPRPAWPCCLGSEEDSRAFGADVGRARRFGSRSDGAALVEVP